MIHFFDLGLFQLHIFTWMHFSALKYPAGQTLKVSQTLRDVLFLPNGVRDVLIFNMNLFRSGDLPFFSQWVVFGGKPPELLTPRNPNYTTSRHHSTLSPAIVLTERVSEID